MENLPEWIAIFVLSLMAGLAMPLGAVLAKVERIGPRWLEDEFRHAVIAFGGGALLSVVALVLVPEGAESNSILVTALCFGGGGVAFALQNLPEGFNAFRELQEGDLSRPWHLIGFFLPDVAFGSGVCPGGSLFPPGTGCVRRRSSTLCCGRDSLSGDSRYCAASAT